MITTGIYNPSVYHGSITEHIENQHLFGIIISTSQFKISNSIIYHMYKVNVLNRYKVQSHKET